MASISVGGRGGRKALDSAIPLVPFIDLLLCCVMFLLVTAVWNDLAALPAAQRVPGPSMDNGDPPDDGVTLALRGDGYELSSRAGDRQWIDARQRGELKQALAAFRQLHTRGGLTVSAEDGVRYNDLAAALDTARGVGFQELNVSDGSGR